jgi:hypothetical protein
VSPGSGTVKLRYLSLATSPKTFELHFVEVVTVW